MTRITVAIAGLLLASTVANAEDLKSDVEAAQTTREMKLNSSAAQGNMDQVGEAATTSADETTREMRKDATMAQEKFDDVGEAALTE